MGSNPWVSHHAKEIRDAPGSADHTTAQWRSPCRADTDGTIGRTLLDGTGAKKNFITGTSEADAVVARSDFLYWINGGFNSIARSNINGSNVDQNYITASDIPGFNPGGLVASL